MCTAQHSTAQQSTAPRHDTCTPVALGLFHEEDKVLVHRFPPGLVRLQPLLVRDHLGERTRVFIRVRVGIDRVGLGSAGCEGRGSGG